MSAHDTQAGTVETLTAEVRTLVIGNRQVTLSVLGQLDTVHPFAIRPFGRVRPQRSDGEIRVAGRQGRTGELVKSWIPTYAAYTEGKYRELCWCPPNGSGMCRCNSYRFRPDGTEHSTNCQGCGATWKKGHNCFCSDTCECETCQDREYYCLCQRECTCPSTLHDFYNHGDSIARRWESLPLLVLAGLR